MAVLIAFVGGLGVLLIYLGVLERFDTKPNELSRRGDEQWGLGARRWLAIAAGVAGSIAWSAVATPGVGSVMAGLATFSIVASRSNSADSQRHLRAATRWPDVLEATRVRTTGSGMPLPNGLLELKAPGASDRFAEALELARRQYRSTSDFNAALEIIKSIMQDGVTDSVCESLSVLQHSGTSDLDQRLQQIIEARRRDLEARLDATARQNGFRFARKFVLIVPAAMALAGALMGGGFASYRSPQGQLLTGLAITLTWLCWHWSGRLAELEPEPRVFGP